MSSKNVATTVRLEEARARLGELVIHVMTTGETVTITRYGKPVVDLVPHPAASAGDAGADESQPAQEQ